MIPGNANPLLLASAAAAAGPTDSNRSLRFNKGDSAHLDKTFSSAGNRKIWTFAAWIKRSLLGTTQRILRVSEGTNSEAGIQFLSTDKIEIYHYVSGYTYQLVTTAVFRDPSSFYHIVVSVDTSQATAADRVTLYVNGSEVTDFSTSTYPTQNFEGWVNDDLNHSIAGQDGLKFSGYMAHVFFIDGSALNATSFGAFDSNGVWQKADYSGTFGTNGFHLLDFANESTIGADSSGNNNDFTANNLSDTAGAGNDVLFDYPANGDSANDSGAGGEVNGNYATLNPVAPHGLTLANGNLDGSGSVIQGHAPSTIFASSGKFYCEFTLTTYQNDTGVGVAASIANPGEDWIGEQAYTVGYLADGRVFQSGSSTSYSSYAAGDVIGAAFDVATGKVWFHKNGTYLNSGNPAAGTGQVKTISGGYALGFTFRSVGGAGSFNFGARSFAYSAPSGFKALCTTNLPTPTIADGSDYFDVQTYDGTGASQTLGGLSFSADLFWRKCTSANQYHNLVDSVRGLSKSLISNGTFAESSAQSNVSNVTSTGYDIGTEGAINTNGETYVAWLWDAGSSTVSNTDGTITSSVRVNQSAGFSIVSYSASGTNNDSVGHGLNAKPEFFIIKARDRSSNWFVYTDQIDGSLDFLYLNKTDSKLDSAATAPTSSVFYAYGTANVSGDSMIAYCFAPVAGFSAFGSYTGDAGSSNFVHLGFRPRLLVIKRSSDGSNGWHMADTARSPENVANEYLYADTSGTEETNGSIDILSNGFCLKANAQTTNNSGVTYIYMAWAENPFQANGGLAR